MNYLKLADRIANDVAAEQNETAAHEAAEIRLLSDLELVAAGGGDATPDWP
jgi:hypothetical protein